MQKRLPIGILIVTYLSTLVLLLAGCGESDTPGGDQAPADTTPLPVVEAGDEVVAEGEVVPIQSVELKFELSGTVADVLVDEGSQVKKGDPLARIDTRELVLSVEEAEAQLEQSRADYDELLEGATASEIASAEASVKMYEQLLDNARAQVSQSEAEVARAQGQFAETKGGVTTSDIEAAQAKVARFEAELKRLEEGPKATDRQQTQSAVEETAAELQDTKDRLSAAKTAAYEEMQQAANRLRDAQQNYSDIYWDNREKERNWDSPDVDVDQDLRDREESALRAVRTAESELEQARVDYEEAQQRETAGIAAAEARLRDVQARHTDMIDEADPEDLAEARANLAQARAELAALQGQKRTGQIAAAAAGIDSAQATLQASMSSIGKAEADLEKAQADLESVTADPEQYEIDAQMALIKQNEVNVRKAKLNLEKATLASPIDGTVVEFNPKQGEWFNNSQTAAIVADLSEWEIETTDLDELEIVNVRVGSLVRITFDALPDVELPGRVTEISNQGENNQGDIVYKVTVKPDQWDERLRWKMTATVAIEPEEAEDSAQENNSDDAEADTNAEEESTETAQDDDE